MYPKYLTSALPQSLECSEMRDLHQAAQLILMRHGQFLVLVTRQSGMVSVM